MPPTLKKWGAYCFRIVRSFVRLFVPPFKKNIKAQGFEISYIDSSAKNSLPLFFFLSELSPLAELCPFEGLKVQICNHDISKTITARSFKLGQLIEDDKQINW